MSYIDDENISRLGTQNLPLVKQVALFFTGWVGFQILGTILKVIIVAIFSNVKSAGDFSSLASILINSLTYIFLLVALISIVNIDIFKLFLIEFIFSLRYTLIMKENNYEKIKRRSS